MIDEPCCFTILLLVRFFHFSFRLEGNLRPLTLYLAWATWLSESGPSSLGQII
jgi:hypothetical protein